MQWGKIVETRSQPLCIASLPFIRATHTHLLAIDHLHHEFIHRRVLLLLFLAQVRVDRVDQQLHFRHCTREGHLIVKTREWQSLDHSSPSGAGCRIDGVVRHELGAVPETVVLTLLEGNDIKLHQFGEPAAKRFVPRGEEVRVGEAVVRRQNHEPTHVLVDSNENGNLVYRMRSTFGCYSSSRFPAKWNRGESSSGGRG